MKSITTLLLGACLATTATLPLTGCKSDGPTYDFEPAEMVYSADEAKAKATQWLIENQHADGSWGGKFVNRYNGQVYEGGVMGAHDGWKQATCALAAQALFNEWRAAEQPSSELTEATLAALNWMCNQSVPGRSNAEVFYSSWAHVYKLELAALILEEPEMIGLHHAAREMGEASLQRLVDMQTLPGGWAYYDFGQQLVQPAGDQTTMFLTAAVLTAMEKAQHQGIACDAFVMERAAALVHALRTPDGAFSYSISFLRYPEYNRIQGAMGRIAIGHLSMYRAGQQGWIEEKYAGNQQDLINTMDLFRLHRSHLLAAKGTTIPHEKLHNNAGYYVMFGHYNAAQVAHIARQEGDKKTRQMGERFSEWLLPEIIEMQHPNGTFLDFPLYGYGHAYGTAYGLMALQELTANEDAP